MANFFKVIDEDGDTNIINLSSISRMYGVDNAILDFSKDSLVRTKIRFMDGGEKAVVFNLDKPAYLRLIRAIDDHMSVSQQLEKIDRALRAINERVSDISACMP
jgi:hypothetical protein